MKLTGARLRTFCAKPDPAVAVALVYGPDRGLVRERAQQLIAALAGAPADPFRLAEVTADAVKADPVRLADEALALPFGGGRRVVLVREAGDAVAPAVRALLALPAASAALTVLEGGELTKRSALRQLCENDGGAVAIACYEDEGDALRRVITDTLAADGLQATPAALDHLAHSLGVDRAVTRGELAKLATYMGAGLPGQSAAAITLDDVRAVIDDGHGASLSGVAFAAAGGDAAAVDHALAAAWREGVSPVAILRATATHLQRLLAARTAMRQGHGAGPAMAALKPPVLFFHQDAFRRQLDRWDEASLAAALGRLAAAEIACKSTGAPQSLIAARALLALAGALRG